MSILVELPYLAPIQFYSKFLRHPIIWIEQWENYRKGSFRNRCIIASANGPLTLSIPLKQGKHQQMPIREVKVDNIQSWQNIHWRSIQSAYGKAPFFEFYIDSLLPIFSKKALFLFDFSFELQSVILDLLGISTQSLLTKIYQKESFELLDYRNKLLPKNYLNNQDPYFLPEKYAQVFEDRYTFQANLSILDLLFCTGPEAKSILQRSLVHL